MQVRLAAGKRCGIASKFFATSQAPTTTTHARM
jgi:hypothetical protein